MGLKVIYCYSARNVEAPFGLSPSEPWRISAFTGKPPGKFLKCRWRPEAGKSEPTPARHLSRRRSELFSSSSQQAGLINFPGMGLGARLLSSSDPGTITGMLGSKSQAYQKTPVGATESGALHNRGLRMVLFLFLFLCTTVFIVVMPEAKKGRLPPFALCAVTPQKS